MANYMYVNDLFNSGYLTKEQERRFENAKVKATAAGHEFLSQAWKDAWSEEFGELIQ